MVKFTTRCTAQKPRDDFVQVNKTLSATRKNIPYRSLLSEGSFKKIEFRVYFWPFPFPYIWRAKSKLNNQQKSNSSFEKQIFQKLFLKKAYICPDFFAYRVKGFLKGGDARRKKLQLNSCQAKDKPPRPLRSERSRKADGTASSRIACQESTLWQCWQQLQFDVTLFKAHEPLCMRHLSDETNKGE